MPNYKTTNPGRKPEYKTKPERANEKINSYDVMALIANAESIINMAEGLSQEEKDSIFADFSKMQTDHIESMGVYMDRPPYLVTSMSHSGKSWFPMEAEYAQDVEAFKRSCKKLSDALYNTIQNQPDDEKNPFAVYYADYLRGLSENRSFMAQYGNDNLLENTAEVINSNVNLKKNNGEGYTYQEICDKMADVPIVDMLSEANAMHRIITDESIRGDLHPDKELKDKAEVIRLCNKFKENCEKLQNYDDEKFNEFYEEGYVQNNKEQFLSRGLKAATEEAEDRMAAVKHGWLVRDLPFISRCRYMSQQLNNKAENNPEMGQEQKEQIQEFDRYIREEVLNNDKPMNEARRAELIAGVKSRFIAIDLPEIKTAIEFQRDKQLVNSNNVNDKIRVDSSRALEMLNQIDGAEKRKLANYEKATLKAAGNSFEDIIDHFDELFSNMPEKPSRFIRVSGEYQAVEDAYYELKIAVKNASNPESDPEVRARAKDLFIATEKYNSEKDKQKSIDPEKTSLSKRRIENVNKRTLYGQYRYNLSDELHTCAGLMMKVCDKEEYRNLLDNGNQAGVKKTNMSNLIDKFNMNNNINSINDSEVAPEKHYEVNYATTAFKGNKKTKNNSFIKV